MPARAQGQPPMPTQVFSQPHPDPTVLTTQQLQREIATAREVIEARLSGFQGATETRLTGLERAIALEFSGVAKQFAERDERTTLLAAATSTAVAAALQAQKEAVGAQTQASERAGNKSEATATKQIEQITLLLQANDKGTSDKISDLKDRMAAEALRTASVNSTVEARFAAIEGRVAGVDHSEGKSHDAWILVFGACGMISTVIVVIIAVLSAASKIH